VVFEARASNSSAGKQAAPEVLGPLLERPRRSALLFDVDGTLAPIVSEPEEANVPIQTRALLRSLSDRYGLLACVSGRRAEDARRVVGIESLAYIGNHGLECLSPDGMRAEPLTALEGDGDAVGALARAAYGSELRRLGVRLEDKGPIWSFHWRNADDERLAREAVGRVASLAREQGLVPHWGRKVLEIRPATRFDKGTAIAALLERASVTGALYAGDDTTDVDAFRKLHDLRKEQLLEHAVCVGVRSGEAPAAVVEEADIVVDGPSGVHDLLSVLAA
jgi:trehalose 6-phosphate phosphatase